jgi:DNA polymerase-3 subunit gamma/tau
LTLAVKYRPSSFDDVIGQDTSVKIIKNSLNCPGSKTYMFSGTRGSGKTTIARLVASHLNVSKSDIFEIDGATYNKVEHVESMIIPFMCTYPSGDKKILIIDECHMLSKFAWSALLKPLEDLAEYMVVVFCTTDVSKIMSTILSRCLDIRLPNISSSCIYERLKHICSGEDIKASDDALVILSKMAGGSLREAISLLESCHLYSPEITDTVVWECLNLLSDAEQAELIKALQDQDLLRANKVLDGISDMLYFYENFLNFCTDQVLLTIKGESTFFDEKDLPFLRFILKKMLNLQLRFAGSDIKLTTMIRVFFVTLIRQEAVTAMGTSNEPVEALGLNKVLDTCGFVRVW